MVWLAVAFGIVGVLGSFATTTLSVGLESADWVWTEDSYRRLTAARAASWVAAAGVGALALGRRYPWSRWLGIALLLPVPIALTPWIGGLIIFAGAPLLLAVILTLADIVAARRREQSA